MELAQLEYMLPRLARMWTHLSRIRGGIGLRGPGETQIEVDLAVGAPTTGEVEIRRLQAKFDEIQATLDHNREGSRLWSLANRCIYGTDANDRMARTSKMNMIMHGDGHGGQRPGQAPVGQRVEDRRAAQRSGLVDSQQGSEFAVAGGDSGQRRFADRRGGRGGKRRTRVKRRWPDRP